MTVAHMWFDNQIHEADTTENQSGKAGAHLTLKLAIYYVYIMAQACHCTQVEVRGSLQESVLSLLPCRFLISMLAFTL